jgi:hypothetical protein
MKNEAGPSSHFQKARKQEERSLAKAARTVPVQGDDLEERIKRKITRLEKPLSTYEVTKQYILDNFTSQAKALQAIYRSNNPDEQLRSFKQTFIRRHQFGVNVHRAINTGALTESEQNHLQLIDGFGITLLDYAAKNLDLFYKRHHITERLPNDPSNIITAEAAQELAELFIRATKSVASPKGSSREGRTTLLDETILPLCQTVLQEAMGQEEGKKTYESLVSGAIGMAAAYHVYSDQSLNRFGKSFLVRFPSPYLDAIEQTDLLLIDVNEMTEETWEAIAQALAKEDKDQSDALRALSPEAKAHVYKVQVKCRRGRQSGLSESDKTETDNFLRQRCRVYGFDNGDYLVLNYDSARSILERAS